MKDVSVSDIARVFGSNIHNKKPVHTLITDSRYVTNGTIFVCIKGKKVDGHSFAKQAVQNGAELVIAEKPLGLENEIVVENSLDAIQMLAKWYFNKISTKIIGVTGSVGKTTTKDMIAAVLSECFTVGKTEGNANNELGFPKTVLSLDNTMRFAVLEMGMTALGDITKLCEIAKPSIGVITSIGTSHIEKLGSKENILTAKLEISQDLPNGADLFLCGDDDMLQNVCLSDKNIILYGFSNNCNARCEILESMESTQRVRLEFDGKICIAEIPLGEHMAKNATAAFAIGLRQGMHTDSIAKGLSAYSPSGMRQRFVDIEGLRIVEDCYNASPESMSAALKTLADMKCNGKKIAVLSDMLELGEISKTAHTKIGKIAGNCADIVAVYGNMTEEYINGINEVGGKYITANSMKTLAKKLSELASAGDILWFKASRGMQLELAVNELYDILKSSD